MEGKPNKKDSKEDKTTIYSSELKGNFQIGLGEFITTISIIFAILLLLVGLYNNSNYNTDMGYLLIQGSIGILFFGVIFGMIITSLGRLVYNSEIRTEISKKLSEEKGIKLVD